MGARILAVPFAVWAGYALYRIFAQGLETSVWFLFPPFVILAVIYVLHPQINDWWVKQVPPPADPRLRTILHRFVPAYAAMSSARKAGFEKRLSIFMQEKSFEGKEVKDIPEDIRALICAYALLHTIDREDYLYKHFGNIILYPHPFLSPAWPDDVHVSETEFDDGVLIFSLEQLIPGLQNWQRFYNIALHEWSRVYLHLHPIKLPEDLKEDAWNALGKAGYWKKQLLEDYIGVPQRDVLPVLVSYYLQDPGLFKGRLPAYYDFLRQYLPVFE